MFGVEYIAALIKVAFIRYCKQEHRSKHGKFKIEYVGKAE